MDGTMLKKLKYVCQGLRGESGKVPIEHGNLVATASKWARVCLTLKGWGMHPSAKCTC
jgi:hypothetical protein